MFKKTSLNEQSRERRIATDSRSNTGGIDEGAFKAPDHVSKKQELTRKKMELQAKISKLNAQIALAKRRYNHREGGRVSSETIHRWEAERANLASLASDMDSRLTGMKLEGTLAFERNTKSFAECFKEMAKELLAEVVYNRLVTATIHRMAEQPDDQS